MVSTPFFVTLLVLVVVVPRLSWDGMVYFMIPWPSLLIVFAKYVSLLHSVLRDELDSSTWRCPFFLVFRAIHWHRAIHWQNHRTVI